jgi:hypothetical protein
VTLQILKSVGRFNTRGISEFAELLRLPLSEVLLNIDDLMSKKDLAETIKAETSIRPVDSRLQLGEILYETFKNNKSLRQLQSDQGLWSWLAAAWLPTLFENSPKSAKIGATMRSN